MLSNSCHVATQKIFTNLLFSVILKGIINTLQNLMFVQLSVDEIVGKVWVRNSLVWEGLKLSKNVHKLVESSWISI